MPPAMLPGAAIVGRLGAVLLAPLAMGSPWWEDYGIKETYLCDARGAVVLERNDAQASLITGRYRTTLFRQRQPPPGQDPILGIVYRNDQLTLILRGDQMILEQLPQRTSCMRTEST